MRFGVTKFRRLGWKRLDVDGTRRIQISPRFLRTEDEDRREQTAERIEDSMHRRLSRAAPGRIWRVAVHPVFRDVDLETAQIDRAEVVQRMVNFVELVGRISFATFGNHVL